MQLQKNAGKAQRTIRHCNKTHSIVKFLGHPTTAAMSGFFLCICACTATRCALARPGSCAPLLW
eukprot:scaffold291372_cov21-Tisochrysis_lutea.AAC.1